MSEAIALRVATELQEPWGEALRRAGYEVLASELAAEADVVVCTDSPPENIDEVRIVRLSSAETEPERVIALASRRLEQLSGWKNAPEGVDAVTGIPVREALYARIENEIELSARIMKPFAVAILDPDGMEAILAGLGQSAADAALREFAAFVASSLRRIDGVARYGSQEIGVVMPATYPTAAVAAIDRILSRRQATATDPGTSPSFSAGLATYPLDGDDRDTLLAKAEARLLDARRQGAGRIGVS